MECNLRDLIEIFEFFFFQRELFSVDIIILACDLIYSEMQLDFRDAA